MESRTEGFQEPVLKVWQHKETLLLTVAKLLLALFVVSGPEESPVPALSRHDCSVVPIRLPLLPQFENCEPGFAPAISCALILTSLCFRRGCTVLILRFSACSRESWSCSSNESFYILSQAFRNELDYRARFSFRTQWSEYGAGSMKSDYWSEEE